MIKRLIGQCKGDYNKVFKAKLTNSAKLSVAKSIRCCLIKLGKSFPLDQELWANMGLVNKQCNRLKCNSCFYKIVLDLMSPLNEYRHHHTTLQHLMNQIIVGYGEILSIANSPQPTC